MEDLLMGDEAAAYLGLSRQRLYQLAASGIVGRRLGSHWIFTRAELDAYKASDKSKGGRPKDGRLILTPVISL